MMSSFPLFPVLRRSLPRATLILLVCALLQACGADSSCPEQDWFNLGESEASAGLVAAWPQEGCPTSNDLERYKAGRQSGLSQYCLPQHGWHDGQAGTPAMPDCSEVGQGTYLQGWRLGDTLRGFRERVIEIEAEMRDLDDPQRKGVLTHELRQIEIDMEAIRGAATVEGWQN